MTTPDEAGRSGRARPLIYRVMDTAAADPRLSRTDMLVLFFLTKYANADGTGCTVSNPTLARVAHASEQTVRRSVSRLRACGYLDRRRRRWDSAITTVAVPQERSPVSAVDAQERSPVSSRPLTSERVPSLLPTLLPNTGGRLAPLMRLLRSPRKAPPPPGGSRRRPETRSRPSTPTWTL